MNIKMRYVTTRKNKDGSLRYYWQRKGFPLANLPADPAERWRMAENLNRDADGAVLQEVVDGTIGWLIDEYEKTDRYRELAVESRRVYDRWLKVFRQMWGAVPVQGISRRIVVDFAQSLKKKPAVRGQAIAVLSNLCDLAMYFGLATSNPCQKLRLRKPKARDEYWLPADIDKFFEACDGHPRGDAMRLAIKVLCYTPASDQAMHCRFLARPTMAAPYGCASKKPAHFSRSLFITNCVSNSTISVITIRASSRCREPERRNTSCSIGRLARYGRKPASNIYRPAICDERPSSCWPSQVAKCPKSRP